MVDMGFESRQFAVAEKEEKAVIQAGEAWATSCVQAEREVGRGRRGAGSQRPASWHPELRPVSSGKQEDDISTVH